MKKITAIGLALALCPGLALAQTVGSSAANGLPAPDADFAKTAAIGGMAEVQAGRLATTHGTGRAKLIGQQMVTEHGKVNKELEAVAKSKGLPLPRQLDAPHAANIAALSKATGKNFNDLYLEGQVADHQNTIALFQNEANQGTDPDMKAFAAKTLPDIQQHTAMIKAAAGKNQ